MNVLQPDIRTSAYLLEIENKLGPSTQSLEEWVALLSDENWVTLLSDTYIAVSYTHLTLPTNREV